MEKIKDFFHNFSDIFFAVAIAGAMFTVLALNLGDWFDNSLGTASTNKPDSTSEYQDDNIINNKPNNDNTTPQNENNQQETKNNTDESETGKAGDNGNINSDMNTNEQKDETIGKTKKVIIPDKTYGTEIARILKRNGLVDTENDFIRAADSLNLTNRLKSGSFEIPVDAKVEDMVKIIAGQKDV